MLTYHCPLRWSDLDAQGHVNNEAVLDFMQEARVELFHTGPTARLLGEGIVVVGHKVEYLASIDYDDEPLQTDIGVSRVGAARFELCYELKQHGNPVARARTTMCPFDFATDRPVRLPLEIRSHLEQNLTAPKPMRDLIALPLKERGTVTDIFVRWSDNDSFGHVNNVKAYDYIQQARVTATSQWAPELARAGAADARHNWLVARQDVTYLAQMSHRQEPFGARTAPINLGNTSMTLACEIFDPATGEIFTRGATVLVCADEHMRPVRLPTDLRNACQQLLVTD